ESQPDRFAPEVGFDDEAEGLVGGAIGVTVGQGEAQVGLRRGPTGRGRPLWRCGPAGNPGVAGVKRLGGRNQAKSNACSKASHEGCHSGDCPSATPSGSSMRRHTYREHIGFHTVLGYGGANLLGLSTRVNFPNQGVTMTLIASRSYIAR